jgi:hypothetical protein
MKKYFSTVAFALAFSLVEFIFLVVALTAIGLLLGGTVSKWWLAMALAASTATLFWLLRDKKVPKVGLWIAAFLAIISAAGYISSVTIDSTFDGNSYHKTAVGALKNGWNPVYQDINSFNKSSKNTHKVVDQLGTDRVMDERWVNGYPKASWLFAATIYKATNNIESGKAINFLSIAIVFLLAFAYLYEKLGREKSLLVAGLLAVNPVAVSQMFGYFNDGVMGGYIVLLLILLTALIDKKAKIGKNQMHLYVLLFMVIGIVSNIKFTGLAYAGIAVACYWLYLVIKKDWQKVIRLSAVGMSAVLFAVFVIGASSYAKNYSQHGSPLYPLVGSNATDIMTHNEPASFVHKSGPHKFLEANLSPTGNLSYSESLTKHDISPKIPFTIDIGELQVLGSDPDLRQAGYGVWFGGILLLSGLLGCWLLYRNRKNRDRLPLILLPIATVAVTALAFDNSWWARYLPQLSIFPVVVLICLMLLRSKLLSNILAFLLLFNIALTTLLVISYQSTYASAINNNVQVNLPCTGEPVRVVALGYLSGAMYNLWDKCEQVKPVAEQDFDASKATRLMTDIYLVKDK